MEKHSEYSDKLLLELLFLVTCLPMVTIGSSIAALYHTVTKYYLRDEGYVYQEHIRFWTESRKQRIVLTLIVAAYVVLRGLCIYCCGLLYDNGMLPYSLLTIDGESLPRDCLPFHGFSRIYPDLKIQSPKFSRTHSD